MFIRLTLLYVGLISANVWGLVNQQALLTRVTGTQLPWGVGEALCRQVSPPLMPEQRLTD
jgi:hypothetical protein